MAADSLVIMTVGGTDPRNPARAAYHRTMPELRVEVGTPELALDRLAECLELNLDFVSDDFHRDVIRRALADVDRARLSH
jgi:hypothetical protein